MRKAEYLQRAETSLSRLARGEQVCLGRDFHAQLLGRAIVAGSFGVLGGLVSSLLGISPLSCRSTIVTASFWAATLMMVTFKRDVARMLLWLLLLEASLAIYQLSIYSEVGGDYVVLRVGPVLLGGVILAVACLRQRRSKSALSAIWIGCNAPALVPLAQSAVPLLDGLLFWALAVLYPVVFYMAARVILFDRRSPQELSRVVAGGVLATCLVPIFILPFEISERGADSVSELQVGARSYAVLGIVILLAPVLLHELRATSLRVRVLSLSAVLALFALSFSRGALISGLLFIVGIFVFGQRVRVRFFVGLAASFLVSVQILKVVYPELLQGGRRFWVLRTNVGSNATSARSFDLSLFIDSGRDGIWVFGVDAWQRSIAWGHGIGSTPHLFRDATNGVLGYSGMHNMLLTVLAERGLFGFVGTLIVMGRLLKLIIWRRLDDQARPLLLFSLFVFLFFALTTGVELFLNGTRAMNASVAVFLFLYVALLESRHPVAAQQGAVSRPADLGKAARSTALAG